MNLDEFAAALEGFSTTAIAGNLTQELDNLAYQMRSLAPMQSGRLRNSIQLLADTTGTDLSVVLSMVEYGYYQNFGVNPAAQTPFRTLSNTSAERRQPYGVDALEFTPFSYDTNERRFGLPATVFFDYEQLLEQVAFIAENGIVEVINDRI